MPGILEETPDGNGQQPIRVLAKPCLPPWFFFIPEKDTQVWVEFAAGDINSPIWSGVWYPPKATPRDVDGNAPTKAKKIIRTAAGHIVQFDDNGSIFIQDNNGNVITLDANGILIKDCNGNQLVMDKDGVKITNGAGALKLVLLEPLLTWLQGHQHIGNMGSPTPPFPADIVDLNAKTLSGDIVSRKKP